LGFLLSTFYFPYAPRHHAVMPHASIEVVNAFTTWRSRPA
jgi:hypothetical protein